MGLFDKVKNAATQAADAAKSAAENAKSNYESNKAEKEAIRAERKEKAEEKLKEILDTINSYENDRYIFDNIDIEELLDFTKNFNEKILLPFNSVDKRKIFMYPYIEGKPLEKISYHLEQYEEGETPIVLIKGGDEQFVLLTKNNMYFSVYQVDDNINRMSGKIACRQIEKLLFIINDDRAEISCNGCTFASFKASNTLLSNNPIVADFDTLTNYFERIENRNFEISDEEIDELIKRLLGKDVANEIKKYTISEVEKLVFFAKGRGYIICTNKQIFVFDKLSFGTSNVRQFYYEDITSAHTEQGPSSTEWRTALVESALTSMSKTCDLIIAVGGTTFKVEELRKIEAERIIALYHQYRREAKTAASQPQVVVQQATADPMEQLKKLKELLDMGVVSQEEFDAKKKDLLGL